MFRSVSILTLSVIYHLVQRLAEQDQLSAVFIEPFFPSNGSITGTGRDILTFVELVTTYAVTSDDLMKESVASEFDALLKNIQLLILAKALRAHWTGSNANLSRARTYLRTLLDRGWTMPK